MGEQALIAGSELGMYVIRSRDDGKSWNAPELAIADLDVGDIKIGTDGTTYVGTRGRGLLRSRDGLRTWEEVETPSALDKVRSICISKDRFLVGNESRPDPVGIYEWIDGEEWRPLGDLAACAGSPEWWYPVPTMGVHVRHVSRDPHQPDRLYSALQVGGVAISADGGATWSDRRNLDLDVHMVEPDPIRPGVVYAGSGGGGMYRSRDYGDTWDCISEPCGSFVVQFALDPVNPDRMYLGTGRGHFPTWRTNPLGAQGEMWRSDDAGESWRKLSGGLPDTMYARVGAVHVDGQEPRNVFCAGDNPGGGADEGVWHSPDAGESWSHIARLPQVVALCAVHL